MLTHRLPVIVETKGGRTLFAEFDASADELRFVPDPDPEDEYREEFTEVHGFDPDWRAETMDLGWHWDDRFDSDGL
jgi:hypothetical protein